MGDGIQDMYNNMQRGLVQLVDSTNYAETVLPLVAQWAELATEIADNVTGILELHSGNISDDLTVVMAAVKRANRIAEEAETARNLWQSLSREAENLIGRFQDIAGDVNLSSVFIERVNAIIERVQRSLEEAASVVYGLREDVAVINDVIGRAENGIETAALVIAEADLTAVCEAIDQLVVWIGDQTLDMSGFGSNVGSGAGYLEPESDGVLVPGSGMGVRESLTESVSDLCDRVESVSVEVGVCGGVVNSALEYSDALQQQAQDICR